MRKYIIFITLFCVLLSVGVSYAKKTEVLPEVTTRVDLSTSDINRIHCSHSQIGDVLFSDEKGIEAKIHGKDAFIKFSVNTSGQGLQYSEMPAELFVVCGDDMYMMIAEPKKIPAVTINLSSSLRDRIDKARDFFKGLAFEEKNKKLIKHAYTNTLPDYFKSENVAKDIGIFKEVDLMMIKTVRVEGEGIILKEFVFRNETDHDLDLQEEDFLIKEISKNASSVSLDPHHLQSGEKGRLFIVERVKEQGSLLLFSNVKK